jgi:Domain of unknown function (DUF4386)
MQDEKRASAEIDVMNGVQRFLRDLPGSLLGLSSRHRERRSGGRPLPDREAAERGPSHRLVAARIIECVFLAAGIIVVLGVVSLRQDSPDAADLAVSLAQLKDWTFLFGPGLVVPFGNGLILGYLMYKSGLVPRRMAWLGLIGGPLLLIGNIGVLFDAFDPSGFVNVLVVPEFIWEAFLGIYCAIWGFRKDSPILRPTWRGDAAA